MDCRILGLLKTWGVEPKIGVGFYPKSWILMTGWNHEINHPFWRLVTPFFGWNTPRIYLKALLVEEKTHVSCLLNSNCQNWRETPHGEFETGRLDGIFLAGASGGNVTFFLAHSPRRPWQWLWWEGDFSAALFGVQTKRGPGFTALKTKMSPKIFAISKGK